MWSRVFIILFVVWCLLYICIVKNKALSLPSIKDGNNALVALSRNAKESGHGHVEMLARRVAPPSLVVRRTKVGGGHCHCTASETPLWVNPVVTHHLITSTAYFTASEEYGAYRRCVNSKPSMKCIVVPTSSSWHVKEQICTTMLVRSKLPTENLNVIKKLKMVIWTFHEQNLEIKNNILHRGVSSYARNWHQISVHTF